MIGGVERTDHGWKAFPPAGPTAGVWGKNIDACVKTLIDRAL